MASAPCSNALLYDTWWHLIYTLGLFFFSLKHFQSILSFVSVVLKLTRTVLFSLSFQTFWPKLLNSFRSFQKRFGLWPKKNSPGIITILPDGQVSDTHMLQKKSLYHVMGWRGSNLLIPNKTALQLNLIFFVKQTQHIYITFLLYKLAYGTSKKQATLEEQQTLKINYFQVMVRSRWQVPSGNNFKPVRSLLKEKLFNWSQQATLP